MLVFKSSVNPSLGPKITGDVGGSGTIKGVTEYSVITQIGQKHNLACYVVGSGEYKKGDAIIFELRWATTTNGGTIVVTDPQEITLADDYDTLANLLSVTGLTGTYTKTN